MVRVHSIVADKSVGEFPLIYHCVGNREQLYVPHECRAILMHEVHHGLLSAHFGARKTITLLREHVWWPCMPQHVCVLIQHFAVC